MDALLIWENSGVWPIIGNIAIFIASCILEVLILQRFCLGIFDGENENNNGWANGEK